MDVSDSGPSQTPSVTSVPESPVSVLSSADKGELSSPPSSDIESVKIPSKWRDDTLASITEKQLTPAARKEIVQTLVTLVISRFGSNPSTSQFETVARRLILKYPFMRDDIGTGYVSCIQLHHFGLSYSIYVLLLLQASWVHKMVERKRNLVKNTKKRSSLEDTSQSASKKTKTTVLQQRYPVARIPPTDDDDESVRRHKKTLDEEMARDKPRDHLLLPLRWRVDLPFCIGIIVFMINCEYH